MSAEPDDKAFDGALAQAVTLMLQPTELVRDADEPCTNTGRATRSQYEARAAYLERVVRLGELKIRNGCWPSLRQVGLSVDSEGDWQVRVRYFVPDRDTTKMGEIERVSSHESNALRPHAPLRMQLMRAVCTAVTETFEHELMESMYYKGVRLLDPHLGEL